MCASPVSAKANTQSGAALLITLILITLVSLLVFSNSRSVKLQQWLSGNEQASQMAFQAAEMALEKAELELESSVDLSRFCNNKSYTYVINDITELRNDGHWMQVASKGKSVAFNDENYLGAAEEAGYGTALTPQLPRYVIGCIDPDAVGLKKNQNENIGTESEEESIFYFFRVFAVGFGPAGQMKSTLEAHYVY